MLERSVCTHVANIMLDLSGFIFQHFLQFLRNEFKQVYELIFGNDSTDDDKVKAFRILQTWKIRRAQETPTGVLCTLTLLNVLIKDKSGTMAADPHTLNTLYSSTITKFINFATSFRSFGTMYKSAYQLGIDSFLIDLRHACAHGKQTPTLEVFRRSHKYCLEWIKNFYWSKELLNISDVTIKSVRFDSALESKLNSILPFYDALAELLHKNIETFEDLALCDPAMNRWPLMQAYMKENRLQNFPQAFRHLTKVLAKIIGSKSMRLSPRTFFHVMFEKCDYFMQVHDKTDSVLPDYGKESSDESQKEESDGSDGDGDEPPNKRSRKPDSVSIVNLYQALIWHIAKNDQLMLLLDMLFKISFSDGEMAARKQAACLWITRILKSIDLYQKYCDFTKTTLTSQKGINEEVKNIYSYQLDADLKEVFIFVGSQLMLSTLKYSTDFLCQLFRNIDEDNKGICVYLLPLIHPPLTNDQQDKLMSLIGIKTTEIRKGQKSSADKIFTLDDLLESSPLVQESESPDAIWKLSTEMIDWSSQPIGKVFSVESF